MQLNRQVSRRRSPINVVNLVVCGGRESGGSQVFANHSFVGGACKNVEVEQVKGWTCFGQRREESLQRDRLYSGFSRKRRDPLGVALCFQDIFRFARCFALQK